MISADQCMVGSLDSATPPALILPRGKYEETFLIGTVSGAPMAVALEHERNFSSFPADNPHWHGAIFPQIRIELCPDELVDPKAMDSVGLMVRTGTGLFLTACQQNRFGLILVQVSTGHIDCGDHGVGFRNWQVVTGDGLSKVVLWRSPRAKAVG